MAAPSRRVTKKEQGILATVANLSRGWRILLAVAGAIVALGAAWTYVQKWGWDNKLPATYEYVDGRISPLESWQTAQAIAQQQSNLDSLRGELTKWLSELPRITNPQTRVLIQARIDTLKVQILKLEAEIAGSTQRRR